jgi:perosamine synthetase
MWARKRLDISFLDLGYALAACLGRFRAREAARRIEAEWGEGRQALICLSARSGLDLLLSALDWPPGSEVLVSALTIHDIPKILADHGLVAVPVDLDPKTAAPSAEAIERRITSRTRGLLFAHLMGTRIPMQPVLELARNRRLFVIEDCAQAFTGDAWRGEPGADASLFSFGPIKTATALGGGIVVVRDAALAARMRVIQSSWPVQSRLAFLRRVLKYALLKVLSSRVAYHVLWMIGTFCRVDLDRAMNRAVRGFAGPGLGSRIRRRASTPLVALLDRRLSRQRESVIAMRKQRGQRLAARLSPRMACPGGLDADSSFWVFPVLADRPQELIGALRRRGFDATQGESLCVVPPPEDRSGATAVAALDMLSRMVFLPCHAELPITEIDRLAEAVLTELPVSVAVAEIEGRSGETRPLAMKSNDSNRWESPSIPRK